MSRHGRASRILSIGVGVAILTGCTSGSAERPPEADQPEGHTVDPVGEQPSRADGWAVVADGVDIAIAPIEPSEGDVPDGLSLTADAVRIEVLSGELPEDGAELHVELADALPEDEIAALARWHPGDSEWKPVPTALSDDRRTLSATVAEFSEWAVVSGTADDWSEWLAWLAGARSEVPDCEDGLPAWTSELTMFDERNSPLRWCAGTDPADPDVLVVKVANNRGYGMGVELAVEPLWSYSTLFDAVTSGSFAERLGGAVAAVNPVLAGGVVAAGDLLPPGEQMHYGFTQDQVEAIGTRPLVTATRSTTQWLIGLTYSAVGTLDATMHGQNRAVAGAATVVAVVECTGNADQLIVRSDWLTLSRALLSCLSVASIKLAPVAAGIVVDLFPNADPTVVGRATGKSFGLVWKVWAAYAAFRVGWNIGERVTDGGLEDSAFQARLLPSPKPTLARMVLSPEGLGPVRLGADPSGFLANAEILRRDADRCEFPFDDAGRWIADYPPMLSIWGNEFPPFSIDVVDGRITRIDVFSAEPRTAEGVGVGSSLDELRAAYGDRLRPGEDTGLSSTWLVAGGGGLLVFEVAEPAEHEYWPSDDVIGRVLHTRIIPGDGDDPGRATAATDDIAGAC